MPGILPTIEQDSTKEPLPEKVKKRTLSWVEREHVNKAVELYLQSLKLIDNDEIVIGVSKNSMNTFNVYLERKPNE